MKNFESAVNMPKMTTPLSSAVIFLGFLHALSLGDDNSTVLG